MVAISPCMKAHGIVELANGHFSPLGQYTSEPEPYGNRRALSTGFSQLDPRNVEFSELTCRLMLSRLHGKQNLWWLTDGHCTKCVSSRRSWQIVHFNVGFGAVVGPAVPVADADCSPSTGGGPLTAFGADGGPPGPAGPAPCWAACASEDVTVVLDTCRDPDDRRPLDEPD